MAAQLKQFVRRMSVRQGRPARIVAVVGAGHMAGIAKQWKLPDNDLYQISVLPTKHTQRDFREYVQQRLAALATANPDIRHAQHRRRKWLTVPAAGLGFLLYCIGRGSLGERT